MEIYHTVNIDTNPRITLGLTGMLRRQIHNNKQAKLMAQWPTVHFGWNDIVEVGIYFTAVN